MTYDLSGAEAAERLKVDPSTLSRWRRLGKYLTFQQVGGCYRYASSEIDRLLTPNKKD